MGTSARSEPLSVRQKLLNLKDIAAKFQVAYDLQHAYRTSNIQRPKDRNYRSPRALQHAIFPWHQRLASIATTSHGQDVGIFIPTAVEPNSTIQVGLLPFIDLNGFQYHDNWLHNLLIASSMNGLRPAKQPDHMHPLERVMLELFFYLSAGASAWKKFYDYCVK